MSPVQKKVKEPVPKSAASQVCLLSSSDEGSGALEKFLRDKFGSLSGKGLEKIVQNGLSGVLELSGESHLERGDSSKTLVGDDKEMPEGGLDRILR